jgi:RNA polymerase sigma-70 factor (ECF subfamily)
MNAEDTLPTRLSLLGRLKDWGDQRSWQEFFDTYGHLLHRVARQAGLSAAEAQDVVQDTVLAVARGIGGFRANPKRGSFQAWLRQITRRRIADHSERRARQARLARELPPVPGVKATPESLWDASRTATLERVPDPETLDLDRHWDEQWEKHLYERTLAALRERIAPEQYQMFDLYMTKALPVRQVARLTGVSVPRVYLTKHRVAAQLKREIERLEHEWPEPATRPD